MGKMGFNMKKKTEVRQWEHVTTEIVVVGVGHFVVSVNARNETGREAGIIVKIKYCKEKTKILNIMTGFLKV
jgi:hypothetical protein